MLSLKLLRLGGGAVEQVLSPPDERAQRRLSAIGLALIIAAFIGPALAAVLGLGAVSAFQAGEDIMRTLGSLAALSFVSWLITRKRGRMWQAKGRFVVGLLLCITVGTNVVRAQSQTEDAKRFVRESIEFRDTQMARFAGLSERFEKVDLSKVLTPQGVGTVAGLATSRAALAQYRALLAERDLLLQSYLSKYEQFVNERATSGDMRAGALSAMKENSAKTASLYGGLGRTQRAIADAMEQVLNWGESQAGHLGIQNGQLLFETREQQAGLQALVAKVTDAERAMNAELATAAQTQREAQQKIEDQNRRAAEFIGK